MPEDTENGPEPQRSPAMVRIRVKWLILGSVVAAISMLLIFGKYQFIPKRFGVVVPGRIYRSGQISKRLIEGVLSKHDIRVVIDLTGIDPTNVDQRAEIEACQKGGIQHVPLVLGGDGTGDIRHYAKALAILQECEREGQPVLVHCATGAQRTGGVIAAYLLLLHQASPGSICKELMRYGWKPHKDQILLDYLNEHMAELATLLVEMDVLPKMPDSLPSLAI